MNKRQKKKMNSLVKVKGKAFITVDATNVSNGSKIEVYIPTKYEIPYDSNTLGIINTEQKRKVSTSKILKNKYTYVAYVKGAVDKEFSITLRVGDKPYPYLIKSE